MCTRIKGSNMTIISTKECMTRDIKAISEAHAFVRILNLSFVRISFSVYCHLLESVFSILSLVRISFYI